MNVGIVVPPIKDFYFTPHRASFIGAHLIKKILQKKKIFSEIIIFPLLKKKPKTISLPDELSYLKEFIFEKEKSPISFFKNYKIFGPSLKHCAKFLNSFNFDVLIISCFAFCYANEAIDLAVEIKKINKKIFLVIGGSGVTVFPDFFIKQNCFDQILVGEFETLADDFLKNLYAKKKKVLYAKHYTEQKDLEFLISNPLTTSKIVYYSTILSRGCFKSCEFCSNHILFGKRIRLVEIKKVLKYFDSINFYSNRNRKIFFNFEDDNILFKKDYLLEVLSEIRKRITNIFFSFENGLDYQLLDINFAKKLIDLGIRQFNFSLVNMNREVLSLQKRGLNLTHLTDLCNFISSKKIPIIIYFICGLKNDSPENIIDNLLYLYQLPVRIGISPFYPVPRISYFEDRNIFLKNSPILCKGSSMFPWNKNISTRQFITAFRLVRFINLLKKKNKNTLEEKLIKEIFLEKKLITIIDNQYKILENLDNNMIKNFFEKLSS